MIPERRQRVETTPASESRQASAPRRQIGPYRIVHQLGSGGMGTVYLAVRTNRDYEQRVALKVLKSGLNGAEVMRRFRQERQILARLEHPHIANLKDGGSTEDGIPYLAMEYVEGERIDRYCERCRLGLRQRIRLMHKVATAVFFCHRSSVLHCDLKPANILVREDGEPKILDFGIAKLQGTEAPAAIGLPPVTPAYASPEQLQAEPVSAASDVYSLGVVLYELLTGRRPYPPSHSLAERLEQLDMRLESPSQAARKQEIGGDGRGSGAFSWRQLAGDLDSLVLKALAREPSRRYESAGQLAADLERCLHGRPVLARKPTATYRLRELVRRHLIPRLL